MVGATFSQPTVAWLGSYYSHGSPDMITKLLATVAFHQTFRKKYINIDIWKRQLNVVSDFIFFGLILSNAIDALARLMET